MIYKNLYFLKWSIFCKIWTTV